MDTRERIFVSVLLIATLFMAPTLRATEIHVPGDYPTIQGAIDAAASGDTVTVAPGTYQETFDFSGKDIHLRSSGGASVTTLEPTFPGGWFYTVIHIVSGEGPLAVVEGFTFTNAGPVIVINGASPTIRNNVFTQTWLVDIDVVDGTPLIRENLFELGQSDVMAISLVNSNAEIAMNSFRDHPRGAVFVSGLSSPVIHHNTIKDCGNYDGWAPAIWIYTDSTSVTTIQDNLFLRNHGSALEAGGAGGYVNVLITDNEFIDNDYGPAASILNFGVNLGEITFERNYCRGPGGEPPYVSYMLRGDYGPIRLANNVFSRVNDSDDWLWTPAVSGYLGELELENCTFEEVEMAVTHSNAPVANMIDSIVWNWINQVLGADVFGPTFDYSDIGPTLGNVWGPNNFSLDPMFVNAAEGDYHLLAGSPCIDAPSGGTSVVVDLDGTTRDSIPDIGAYEYIGNDHWFRGNREKGGAMTVVFQGSPGDAVILGYSSNLRVTPRQTPYGELWLDTPFTRLTLGTIGSNGILEVNFTAPMYDLPTVLYTQALVGSVITPVEELIIGG